MKKIYASLMAVVLFGVQLSFAQTLSVTADSKKHPVKKTIGTTPVITFPNSVKPEKCAFNLVMKNAQKNGFLNSAYESQLNTLIQQKLANGEGFTGTVTIPVVFHVIYRTANAAGDASPNLSTAKFQAQIDQLNIDYANLAGSPYTGVAGDVRIRFCMAVVDTAGRPMATPGIDRINGQTRVPAFSNTNTMGQDELISYFDNTIKPGTIWDPFTYMNVWTSAMDNSGLLGYATFPGLSTLPGLDAGENNSNAGMVINWKSIGSVANPGNDTDYGYGRTLTHEAGHFFGLRHIWGDENCGNDYCADTPPQDDATSGCPTAGTLNNCTPSGPKMFQNYMDYSNDACLNTFTNNQATRCQTVMDNSPRRVSLMTSTACATRAGNSVSFIFAGEYAAYETGNAGTCPNSKTYAFRLYPSVSATGAATVTFNTTGSTAVVNKDFSISPASVTFANGETTAKTVLVTIFDNQDVDAAARKIIIGYNITGTGVVAGPDKQKVTINILDDDFVSAINNTSSTTTLLSENFNASANIPTGWATETFSDGLSTPNTWVVSANGGSGTAGNAAHITENVSTKPNTYNVNNISDAYLYTPLIDASGLKDLNVTFKWRCVGEQTYDDGYLGYIPEGQARTAENVLFFNTTFSGQTAGTAAVTANLNLPASMANTKFYFVFNWFNDETLGASPAFTIDDVVFTGKALAIATTTDSDTSFSFNTGQTVNFYSKNAASPFDYRLIAGVKNPSANIGCVTASVNQAGTSTLVTISTPSGTYQRGSKVIWLQPATANTSATYQATFYYTTAELASWPNPLVLKIMKVRDGVDVFGTVSASDATLYTPTVDDQRATKGYIAYTINATGGFSQFLLVSQLTALPVQSLDFTVKAATKNIVLTWTTNNEINNKGFAIERSKDGVTYEKIAWIDGAGNSSSLKNYAYTDNFVQPDVLYYYRLRQTDLDGRGVLSDIRQAKIKGEGMFSITLSPNPASDKVKIFAAGVATSSDVQLFNAEGQLVRSWRKLNLGTLTTLDISGLAKGIYIFSIVSGDQKKVEKLIIN
ncbi:M43 family zinc metalloprotease [Ferruginibacter sp. HRS2-29]|uniref:M43 family zinc metalloprotease n=1 Tax=Ferruginibacter sp. HRS2-29 TaxID=2487334 RepID=UPI0020CE8AD4|nr:M43 family zinc metalloprotease [Ferruginibacter sp. HRS2-29]MCP9752753.1 T9SS C-terminal target domain-containing protein [Ferruginibacter sp. HRS2-29]